MKIFVTGGTGFIGSHFLTASLAAGHEPIALRRPGSKPRLPLKKEPQWVDGALNDDWRKQLTNCQALVHLAAAGVSPQLSGWDELFKVNVELSLNIWRQAAEAGVRRLIICGSCFEYGRSGNRYDFIPPDAPLEPTAPYHASKAAATMAAIALGIERQLELAVLRPFHVFGEGETKIRFWPSFRKAALAGEDFPMSEGRQIRDFVPVEQVVNTFVDALTRTDLKPGDPKVENLGTGRPQTLRAFAEHWWNQWDAKGKLLIGAVPYYENEVMRYVPQISSKGR